MVKTELILKVRAWDSPKKEDRRCLNFICPPCKIEAEEDGYYIEVVGEALTTDGHGYWCDNCLVGKI